MGAGSSRRSPEAISGLMVRGGYLITLPRGRLNRFKAMRCPGESYSDLIIRVARRRSWTGYRDRFYATTAEFRLTR